MDPLTDQVKDEGSVFWGSFWMIVLSLLLVWLPGLGSLIAGLVGGKIAGSAGRAFLASILPSLLLGGVLVAVMQMLVGVAWLSWLVGLGGFVVGVGGAGLLVIGALIGGLLA